jgi:hypothetical protein
MFIRIIFIVTLMCSFSIEWAFSQQLPSRRQPSPWQLQTVMNIGKLEKSVSLDKTKYFPGEAYSCEIVIRNPTAEPVVTQSPFTMSTVYLTQQKLHEVTHTLEYEKMLQDLSSGVSPFSDPITFAPGKTIQRSFDSHDEAARPGDFVPYHMPDELGQYRLVLDYDARVFAAFEIVAPVLVLHREIAIPKEVAVRSNVTDRPARRFVAFVFESSDGQYLCEMADARMETLIKPTPSIHNPWRGFRCTQKLSGPVSDLALNMDESGKITVVWREAIDGQIQTQRRDVKLQSLQPAER